MVRLVSMLCCLMVISGCSGLGKKEMSVWEIYDVSHPVPANSAVPASRANNSIYMDNDSYYTPPRAYGSCSADDPTMAGCE